MPGPDGIILGFDPGGAGNFGWSVCVTRNGRLQKPVQTCVANDALSALRAVEDYISTDSALRESRVLAAGIDAPMFWSRKGNRYVEEYLQSQLKSAGIKTSSILKVNSLWGAVVVQGALLAKYLSETWNLKITESHPGVLRHLLHCDAGLEIIRRLTSHLHDCPRNGKDCSCGCKNKGGHQPNCDVGGHRRDATLAAISAWAMIHQQDGWEDLYEREPQPVQPFNTPVAYWMPKLQETQHS